ncbi:peptidylprolyl isomerase, partial [Sphingomonas sanguinis]|uniref:peptidylprolyl isomerase n=1 Tax=Sphingomonas sanguinis TaxID=33051 RepID=UPI003B968DC8
MMRVFAALAVLMASPIAVPAQAQKQAEVQPKFSTPAKAAQVLEANVTDRAPVPPITDKENLWLLDLSTGGRVTIWLRPDVAPKMVERIKTLTRRHFYDGLTFHRVIDGFMAQGG